MIPSIIATSFCVLGTIVSGSLWYTHRVKKRKRFVIDTYIFGFVTAVSIPFLINELYKTNSGYKTLWEAKDVLSFYGSFLAFLGTVALGVLALWQNKKANDINKRLLEIEEVRSVPFLHIDSALSVVDDFREHGVDISIAFKNDTDSVINIVDVADLQFDTFLIDQNNVIPFCKNWTNHYSVLPHESRKMNFFNENKKEEPSLIQNASPFEKLGLLQLHCRLEIKIQFANSSEVFVQKFEFAIILLKVEEKKKYHSVFENIECSIKKEDNQYDQH